MTPALAVLALAAVAAGEPPVVAFLRDEMRLGPAQSAALERGEVVTQPLESADKAEVAVFGVLKAAGDADRLFALASDVRRSRRGPRVPEIGVFSGTPRLEDLAGLTYPAEDLAALRKCRPGACDVKLGPRALERLAAVDWSKADADAKASALLNEGIVEYVAAYQKGGFEALGHALDKKDPRSRAAEYRALVARSPFLARYVGEFAQDVAGYPQQRAAGAAEVFYWTKDTSGPKPVVSLYHATVWRGPRGVLVAQRLLASTHFFNAGLELTAAVAAPDGSGLYLMTLYRTRLDPPTGMLAGVLLGKVKAGIETGLRESLTTTRDRLEEKP